MRFVNRSSFRGGATWAGVTMALLLGAMSIRAAVPAVINYQGRLTDNTAQQNPVNATVTIDFLVWDSATGGSALWSETQSVQVVSGLFNTLLGSTVPIPPTLFSTGATRYLEIHVSGETLTPRQRIAATPFASVSASADDAGSLGGVAAANYQRRIATPCPSGYSINAVAADGTATCIQGETGPQGPPGPGLDAGAISGTLTTCSASAAGLLVYVPGRSSVAYTAADGTYLLSYLPSGTYSVQVGPPGGSTSTTVGGLSVTSGQTTAAGTTNAQNLSIDVGNCGACGAFCSTSHVVRACSGGSCESGACDSGFMDCNANKRVDGCEVNISTTSNCGGCGVACSTNNVPSPNCVAGVCGGPCASGYTDCNNNRQTDGCETDTASSTSNCGGCGIVCSTAHRPVPICQASVCIGNCTAPFADCNFGAQNDACETNLSNDNANCGTCGHVCSGATPTCSGGACI